MTWFAGIFLWLSQASITAAVYYVPRIVGPDSRAESAKVTTIKTALTVYTTIGGMM